MMTFLCQQYCKAFNVAEVILLSGEVKTSARLFALRVGKNDDILVHVSYR